MKHYRTNLPRTCTAANIYILFESNGIIRSIDLECMVLEKKGRIAEYTVFIAIILFRTVAVLES